MADPCGHGVAMAKTVADLLDAQTASLADIETPFAAAGKNVQDLVRKVTHQHIRIRALG
jgi:hypothetical protein